MRFDAERYADGDGRAAGAHERLTAVRVAVTGATGLIGRRLVSLLRARGDDVTALTRNPERARERLSNPTQAPDSSDRSLGALETVRWDPLSEAAPAASLAGHDAVVHLAGENVAQRWSASAKRAILDSRVEGTKQLVRGLTATEQAQRPRVLVSGSAIGYYGAHGDEPIDEDAPAGGDFLARTCRAWEIEALEAQSLGMRVATLRTGVVLDRDGGALAKMLPPFKLGVGGPVAGGHQFVSWVHLDDVVAIALAAIDGEQWDGPINATAPEPRRNRDFSRALGRVLHRPSLLPIPGAALRLLYGEMAEIVTGGARVLPAKALVLGYQFRYPQLDAALRAALGSG
jgi:uncharacterized protein (TIGR01777 family)